MGFAHILYAEVRRAQRITNPTEIGQVSQIKTIMWRKIVWSRMEMSRERRFSEFFTLLQNEIDEEFERAERQDRIESRVVFVPVINVLQSIADATVPYCPTVCLHY
jgi:hypothetical protein